MKFDSLFRLEITSFRYSYQCWSNHGIPLISWTEWVGSSYARFSNAIDWWRKVTVPVRQRLRAPWTLNGE